LSDSDPALGAENRHPPIRGRQAPILQHVLDALAAAGVGEVIVVLGRDADAVEAAITWRDERRVVNPEPGRGLSSSLQLGFQAIGPDAGSILVALGDQPLVSAAVIQALMETPADDARPIVVPVYPGDGGRNPVLLRPAAYPLVAEATGDRGLGPVLVAHPELLTEVAVRDAAAENPDVDTAADHARAIESVWAARVRTNRDQVERIREIPDGTDFYAPVNSLFRADPTRTDDAVLDALLGLVRSGETWLDVGAGAGRYALPIGQTALYPYRWKNADYDKNLASNTGFFVMPSSQAGGNPAAMSAPLTYGIAAKAKHADCAAFFFNWVASNPAARQIDVTVGGSNPGGPAGASVPSVTAGSVTSETLAAGNVIGKAGTSMDFIANGTSSIFAQGWTPELQKMVGGKQDAAGLLKAVQAEYKREIAG